MMKSRMILAAGTLGAMFASPAFAQEAGALSTAPASRMSARAQIELLPMGSGKETTDGASSPSRDAEVAYGISAAFDYALTPYLSVGAAPRLVLNVAPVDSQQDADKEIDLRARISAHYPVARGLDINASIMPGYTIGLSGTEAVGNATGFAIGGAVGLTYDVSPKLFIAGEVGYQRAFLSADLDVGPQTQMADLELSYMHVGLGAGTRF